MINVVGAAQETQTPSKDGYTVFTPGPVTPPAPPVPEPPVPIEPLQPEVNPAPSSPPLHKTPSNTKRLPLIIAVVLLLLLVVGGGVALYLIKVNQDLRQQASGGQAAYACTTQADCPEGYSCSTATHACVPPPPAPTATDIPRRIADTPVPTTIPTIAPTAIPTETVAPTDVPVVEVVPTVAPAEASNAVVSATGDTPAPTATPTKASATPTPTSALVQTTANCNESCTSNSNCINPSHVCFNGVCRLDSNPEDTTCRLPSGGTQVAVNTIQGNRTYTPYASPSGTTPTTGPADWLRYLQVGAGMLGLGTLLLLFL